MTEAKPISGKGCWYLMTCTIVQPWSLSYHANPKNRRVFRSCKQVT